MRRRTQKRLGPLDRLDVGIELRLPRRDLVGAERLALLAEAPTPVARELELQLLGERVAFPQFLPARGERAVAFLDALEALRDLLFALFDLPIAFRKKLVLARTSTSWGKCHGMVTYSSTRRREKDVRRAGTCAAWCPYGGETPR